MNHSTLWIVFMSGAKKKCIGLSRTVGFLLTVGSRLGLGVAIINRLNIVKGGFRT